MNIGVSAGLLDGTMAQYIVDESEEPELLARLIEVNEKIRNPTSSS